jgi:hypothetical protein
VKVSELRFFDPDTNESAHCKWEYDLPQEEPKQETLEDFIKRESQSANESVGMVKGATWQAKKMYSEEEVRELLTARCKHFGTTMTRFRELLLKQDLEWFEQHKKK